MPHSSLLGHYIGHTKSLVKAKLSSIKCSPLLHSLQWARHKLLCKLASVASSYEFVTLWLWRQSSFKLQMFYVRHSKKPCSELYRQDHTGAVALAPAHRLHQRLGHTVWMFWWLTWSKEKLGFVYRGEIQIYSTQVGVGGIFFIYFCLFLKPECIHKSLFLAQASSCSGSWGRYHKYVRNWAAVSCTDHSDPVRRRKLQATANWLNLAPTSSKDAEWEKLPRAKTSSQQRSTQHPCFRTDLRRRLAIALHLYSCLQSSFSFKGERGHCNYLTK